ncbi:3-keto-5-aminohexanoate cleavage protein [Bradyrhizobium cosmicum]|nr:3-keto-5-aminohexanoate cleavage protein [Bradyrhizobium cosmicum]
MGSTATNLRLVEDALRMVRAHGGEPATTAEVRQGLANG